MSKTLKEAFQKRLEANSSELCLSDVDTSAASRIADMSAADYIAFVTVRKAIKKPSSLETLNIAKVAGELNEGTNITITPIDEALKDCKQ